MNKLTAEWVKKAEGDLSAARLLLSSRPLHTDQVCFHCQQAVEKYLKALLQEHGRPIQKTHDIEVLIDQLVAVDRTLRRFRRGTKRLTRYAVDYRYPGLDTTPRQARAAFETAQTFVAEIRKRLGLRRR